MDLLLRLRCRYLNVARSEDKDLMKTSYSIVFAVVSGLVLAGCTTEKGDESFAGNVDGAEAASVSTAIPTNLVFLADHRVFEPQVTTLHDESVVFTWREFTDSGSNLYAAVRPIDGKFSSPVRVNDVEETVESYAHDGMRAAIAVGSGEDFAVAWSDSRAQIRAAISNDGGKSFAPSFRLDQADAPAYRGFPAISFDPAGNLHAIWIDSRFAEDFAEEPADLFYSQVSDGRVTEMNLTAEQEPSICGCCRTFINAESGTLQLAFRNTTADGYRDPFTISGTVDGQFGEPEPVSDPLWELAGCPMAGPIRLGDEVLWHDGSTGKKLVMTASVDERKATRVFNEAERGDWVGRQPPRAVSAPGGTSEVLLIPGEPNSRLIARADGRWVTISNELPSWATSGAFDGRRLILVGAAGGELRFESRKVDQD
jgi:hypothetical protein